MTCTVFLLVQRHIKPIIHFVINTPKLVRKEINARETVLDIEAREVVPAPAMVTGFQNGRHVTLFDNQCSTIMSLIAHLGVVFF